LVGDVGHLEVVEQGENGKLPGGAWIARKVVVVVVVVVVVYVSEPGDDGGEVGGGGRAIEPRSLRR